MQMGDFMTFLPAFKIFNRNGSETKILFTIKTLCCVANTATNGRLELTVAFYSANQLPKEDMEWAFTLLKSNMEAL